jgi:transcriptional regulator NrdR family protein
MKDWVDGQEAAKAQEAENVRIERELGEAAYTAPVDINRLDRAAQARNANQAQRLADSTRREIATLRRLSAADRVIYARGLSIYRSGEPIRTCPGNVR